MWWWSPLIHHPTNFHNFFFSFMHSFVQATNSWYLKHARLDTSQSTFFPGRLHSTKHWTKPFTTEGISFFSWWKLLQCNTRLKVCLSLLFLKLLHEPAVSCVELSYSLLDSNMMNIISQPRLTGILLIFFRSYSQQRCWLVHFWPCSQIRKFFETLHCRSIIFSLLIRLVSICLF